MPCQILRKTPWCWSITNINAAKEGPATNPTIGREANTAIGSQPATRSTARNSSSYRLHRLAPINPVRTKSRKVGDPRTFNYEVR
jgi:hypothetical protein